MKALFDKAKSQFQLFPQVLSLLWSASPKALFTVLFFKWFFRPTYPLESALLTQFSRFDCRFHHLTGKSIYRGFLVDVITYYFLR